MKLLQGILIIALINTLISCEKVITVDLDTAAPRLVIDAAIDWQRNTAGNVQKIRISTTAAYYDTVFPVVSGATVTVTNTSNTVFSFEEEGVPGDYVCNNFLPVIGETYTLNVIIGNEHYVASETLMRTAVINDNIEQNNEGGMAGDEIELTYRFQDDGSTNNFYIQSTKIPPVAFIQYAAEDDDDTQGGLTPVYYSNEDLKQGHEVVFKLYGISRSYYDYFRKVLNASGTDDGPFATTPVAVKGNINNQTDVKNYPFGYFRLSEVDVKHYTVK